MQTLEIKHSNGNTTKYQLIEGGKELPIAYHLQTSQAVINAMESARKSRTRVRIYIGDVNTGKCWNEEHDISGYIGLSKGREAMYPILVNNARSLGGGGMLDHCIIKIKESASGRVLYQAGNFIQPIVDVKPSTQDGYTYAVYIDGSLYSNHKTERQANLLKTKMS